MTAAKLSAVAFEGCMAPTGTWMPDRNLKYTTEH